MYKKMAQDVLERMRDTEMSWEEVGERRLRVSLVCKYRKGAARFANDMITKWLIPGKQVEVSLHFSTEVDGKLVFEIILELETLQDMIWAKHNAPFLEREILVGVGSYYHAKKIMELRGLSVDEKTALVQEKIGALVGRFPAHFEGDIFEEMQHLFLSVKEEFKAVHRHEEISRIIFVLYLFRKSLEQRVSKNGRRRYLSLKLKKLTWS